VFGGARAVADPSAFAPLAGVTAPVGARVSLALMIAAAVLLTIGWRLALRRRFEAHRWVQTSAVALNAAVVASWMIRSLVVNILPELPARLGEGTYAVATVHAVVGAIGVVFGVFVVLRGNELVPRALRFTNYKLYMRGAYALYLLGTLTGVILYVVAYVGTG
jgi:putative membrane protein